MSEVEIEVKLYCHESKWEHRIYLYYDNQELAQEFFWKPIKDAQSDLNFSGAITSIAIPRGLISAGRHFTEDYRKDRYYKMEIGDVLISEAEILFEEDVSKRAHMTIF